MYHRNWRYLHDNEDRRISNYFFNVGILIWDLWFTKKLVRVEAMSGIAIECRQHSRTDLYHLFMASTPIISRFEYKYIFTLFSGAVTAVPLILFSAGARRIPLSLTGFIQYVSPTIIFLLGIFVFKEKFDIHQFITFIFIWIGIALYSISQYIKMKRSPRPE